MGFKNRLVERSKKLAMTPRVIRVLSDDRVMRAAEGIMDARGRMKAAAGKAGEAWQLLMQGHALPNIDPAIDDDLDVRVILPRASKSTEMARFERPFHRRSCQDQRERQSAHQRQWDGPRHRPWDQRRR